MGDFLFGKDEDDDSNNAMERQIALQEKRIAADEAKQTEKENEEANQRRLNRRGRKSLMSAANTGGGFFQTV